MNNTCWLVSCSTGEYVTDGHGDLQPLVVVPTELDAEECIGIFEAWARSHGVEWRGENARKARENKIRESFPIEGGPSGHQ